MIAMEAQDDKAAINTVASRPKKENDKEKGKPDKVKGAPISNYWVISDNVAHPQQLTSSSVSFLLAPVLNMASSL